MVIRSYSVVGGACLCLSLATTLTCKPKWRKPKPKVPTVDNGSRNVTPIVGSPPTPKSALCRHHPPVHCHGEDNFGMIAILPAPNNGNAPNGTVDNFAIVVATAASTMSRNTTLPSSTWTAAQLTSLADINLSSLPWPSLRIPPLGRVLLVVVVHPLCRCCRSHCRVASRSDSIVILAPPPPTCIVFRDRDTIRVVPPPIRRRPLLIFD